MHLIPLYAKSLTINVPKNHILYTTGVEAPKGIILLSDEDGSHDLMIADMVHEGNEVLVKMKATRVPSRKYEIGEKLGYLLVLE